MSAISGLMRKKPRDSMGGIRVGLAGTDMPLGSNCRICRAVVRRGEPCLGDPLDPMVDGTRRWLGWRLYHRNCLLTLLDEAPLDEFETLREKARAGNLFD